MATEWRQEGQAQFQVGNAFYRPTSQLSRDLGVLAASVYQQETGQLRVIDVMSGCGVRSQRYALESQADRVWANDANPEVHPVLQHNLEHQLQPHQYQITHWPARRLFADCYLRQDFYDLLDMDSFGVPTALISGCLQAVKLGGLVYVTATDGRTLAGHNPEQGVWNYGSILRSHPAAQEQGLRVLIGTLLQQATQQGFTIEPIFSLFQGQLYRVMVRIQRKPMPQQDDLGFLGYCHHCGHYETVGWRRLSRATCPAHESPQPLTLSGPMWLGPLHNVPYLTQMATLAQAWQWDMPLKLLTQMGREAPMPPYYYRLGDIGKQGQMDIPQRERLIQALETYGHAACATHIDAQAVKTTASFQDCVAIASSIQSRSA